MSEIKKSRETLGGYYIAKELAVIEGYCNPYDSEAKFKQLVRGGASEEEAQAIVDRNVSKRTADKPSGEERIALALNLLADVEFYVLDTEAKRLAAIQKVAAAK
jgi:hypothetical protein